MTQCETCGAKATRFVDIGGRGKSRARHLFCALTDRDHSPEGYVEGRGSWPDVPADGPQGCVAPAYPDAVAPDTARRYIAEARDALNGVEAVVSMPSAADDDEAERERAQDWHDGDTF